MRCSLLCLLALVVAAAAAGDPEPYVYDYSYGDSYGEDSLGYTDDYGYYSSDDDAYYEEYGVYSNKDDAFGYDDSYYDYLDYGTDATSSCTTDKDGKVKLSNGTATCDLKLSGADKVAAADKLKSGLDGVYKLSGCYNGRPMYTRKDSPKGEDRVLYYSKMFVDWDISKGTAPNEKDVLAYGTDPHQHGVPLFVQSWHMGADLVRSKPNGTSDETYLPFQLTISCADGQKVKPPAVTPVQQKTRPILTDDEMDQRYKMIYERYGRRPEPNPSASFSFVIMMVMIGLTIVLAIPYMLVKRNRTASKGYQPVATNFAQVIQQSKKKQSGHIH